MPQEFITFWGIFFLRVFFYRVIIIKMHPWKM